MGNNGEELLVLSPLLLFDSSEEEEGPSLEFSSLKEFAVNLEFWP